MCADCSTHLHVHALAFISACDKYRIIFEKDKDVLCTFVAGSQKQETRLSGGASRHCFNNLKPNMQYKISIYAQLQDGTEGPAVTTAEKTRKDLSFEHTCHSHVAGRGALQFHDWISSAAAILRSLHRSLVYIYTCVSLCVLGCFHSFKLGTLIYCMPLHKILISDASGQRLSDANMSIYPRLNIQQQCNEELKGF